MCVFSLHAHTCAIYMSGACRCQKRVLELQTAMNYQVGARKRNLGPLKEPVLLTTDDAFFDLKIATTHRAVMAHV